MMYKLDNMLPMAGLHISHPIAFLSIPTVAMTSPKVRSFLTLMTLNKSARATAKCEQMLVSSTNPARFISALNMFVTYEEARHYRGDVISNVPVYKRCVE